MGVVSRAAEAVENSRRESGETEGDTDALEMAIRLRLPVFPKNTAPRVKIDALEEYILVSAFWSGEMNEERHALNAHGATLQDQWDLLEGWEMLRHGKTDESVNEAKRALRPDLWTSLQATRRRVRALAEEIDRLERDYVRASRIYTLITGS
jgi:hypothetical protein